MIIDFDISIDRETRYWSAWQYVYAEGKDLTELLKDAEVFAYDQDGGEVGQALVSDLDDNIAEAISDSIRAEYVKRITKELENVAK